MREGFDELIDIEKRTVEMTARSPAVSHGVRLPISSATPYMRVKASYHVGNRLDLRGNITLKANLALLIDNAQRRSPQANVHTKIMPHRSLPALGGPYDHRHIRQLASHSEQARLPMLSASSPLCSRFL